MKNNDKNQTFTELYTRYHDRLRSSMIGIVKDTDIVDDVAAEAFTRAYEKIDTFRGEAAFYTWLYRIALNTVQYWSRRRRNISLDALEGPLPQALTETCRFDQPLIRDERRRQVRQALKRIPAKHRRALINRYVHGRTLRAIARDERVPRGTMGSRIFRAKQVFRGACMAEARSRRSLEELTG